MGVGHVTEFAVGQQFADYGRAQRSGAAGDHDMPALKCFRHACDRSCRFL